MGKIKVPNQDESGVVDSLNRQLDFVMGYGGGEIDPAASNLRRYLSDPNTDIYFTDIDDESFEVVAFNAHPEDDIKHDAFRVHFKGQAMQITEFEQVPISAISENSKVSVLDLSLNEFVRNTPHMGNKKINALKSHIDDGGKRYITNIEEDRIEMLAFGNGPNGDIQARAFQVEVDQNLNMNNIEPISSSALSQQSLMTAKELKEKIEEEEFEKSERVSLGK